MRTPASMTGTAGPVRRRSGYGRSVYGLEVHGLDDVVVLGEPTDPTEADLLPVQVSTSPTDAPPLEPMGAERWTRALACGRVLHLDRRAGRATFHGAALSPDLLAHPYLGPVAVGFNRWAGREAFHAAAFAEQGHAWIVVGARTAGKSTLTAALAAAQLDILADDIVIADGTHAFAGPRSIDLRERLPAEVAAHWPSGHRPATPARSQTRWRVGLPPVAPRWPLGGWIFLRWGQELSMIPMPVSITMGRVARWRSLPALESDPATILALGALPAWELTRPKRWAELPETVELLRHTVRKAAPTMATVG